MAAPTLDVTRNTSLWGYDLVMGFSPIDGTATLSKFYGGRVEYVRGFADFTVTTGTYSLIDVEVPLDLPVTYQLTQTITGVSTRTTPPATPVLETTEMFVLRDLFALTYSVVDDVYVGTLQDEESENRMGVFPILNRRDPVIVLDTRQTMTSTLVLLPTTTEQRDNVKRLLNSGSPLMLQSMQSYDIGNTGLLYLQPGRVTRGRVIPDGRSPIRKFQVEYTEISPPPAIVTFLPAAKTYQDLVDTYPTYQDLFDSHKNYFQVMYP